MTDSGKRLDLPISPVRRSTNTAPAASAKTSLISASSRPRRDRADDVRSRAGTHRRHLDKLESIPGRAGLRSRSDARNVGLQNRHSDVAPADKTLYALRDVTGTVESIPLITASILSKKLAEGISGLVMDVKCGRGAFMKTRDDAKSLADSLVRVGRANGLTTTALITAMDAPLGRYVGNSLEVIESIETLKGNGPTDLTDLSGARHVREKRPTRNDAEATARFRASRGRVGSVTQVHRRTGRPPK